MEKKTGRPEVCAQVAADAVVVEPVSTPKFPASREKNRDLFDSEAVSGSGVPVSSMVLGT